MNNLLDATVLAIRLKDQENLQRIHKNLKTIKIIIQENSETIPQIVPDVEFSDTKVKMLYLSKGNKTVEKIVNEILETIDDIFKLNSE